MVLHLWMMVQLKTVIVNIDNYSTRRAMVL